MDRRDKLIRSGLALATELDLPVVLQRIVELAVELTNATYGALGVLASNGSIDEFITVGVTDKERAAIGDPPVGHGILGLLIRETTPVRIPRIGDHPDSYGFPPNHPPMTSRRRRQDEQRDRRRARPGGEDREELRFEHPVQARGRATGRAAAYLARHTTTPGTQG